MKIDASLTIEGADSPIYAAADLSAITLNVKFSRYPVAIPFTANADDIYQHSIDLFNRASAGEFGAIGAYVAPPRRT